MLKYLIHPKQQNHMIHDHFISLNLALPTKHTLRRRHEEHNALNQENCIRPHAAVPVRSQFNHVAPSSTVTRFSSLSSDRMFNQPGHASRSPVKKKHLNFTCLPYIQALFSSHQAEVCKFNKHLLRYTNENLTVRAYKKKRELLICGPCKCDAKKRINPSMHIHIQYRSGIFYRRSLIQFRYVHS